MKKLLAISLVLFISSYGMSQAIQFKKSYGNNGFDHGRGILQQHDSSYLVTGSSSSYLGHSTDAFIMHIDSMGNLLNTNFYGGDESDWGEKIVLGADSSIAVAGYTNSFGEGGYDFYLLNTTQSKSANYEKTYGGTGWDFAYDLIPLADSGYILAGETSSFDAIGSDGYLVRVDKFGDTVWTYQFGPGNGNDAFKAIQKISDTEFFLCGYSQHADSSHEDGYIARMNIDGTVVWDNYFGELMDDQFLAMDTLENTVVLVGDREINNGDNLGLWILKLDYNGVVDWERTTTGNGDFSCTGLVIHDPMNTIVLAQETETPDIPTYAEGNDVFLSGYDFYSSVWNGSLAIRYGSIGNDEARDVIQTFDNGPIFVGTITSNSTGGSNVMVVKIGEDLSHPDNLNWEQDSILNIQPIEEYDIQAQRVYPNPFLNEINVVGAQPNSSIDIYDLKGNLVYSKQKLSNTKINLAHIQSGCYVLRLTSPEGRISQTLINKSE